MEDRETILAEIAKARTLKLHEAYYAVSGIPGDSNCIFFQLPRLILMTAGEKEAVMPLSGGARRLRLSAGDFLYCAPGSWENHDWNGDFDMLCIVPRQDYLRVSLYRHRNSDGQTRPEPLFLHTGLPYGEALRNLVRALNSLPEKNDPEILISLVRALLGMAEQECRRVIDDLGRPEQLFQRVRNWVACSFQEDIDRTLAANVFHISAGYLSQLFKRYHEESFSDYLIQCRMAHARKLLEHTDFSVKQVADSSGFRDYVHFVRQFRRLNGMAPGRYRRKIRP